MHEIRRLGALAQPPRGPMAVSILAASLAVGFGVALMTSAGYLISRAAEQPPILSLTVVIVAVRFFGLARPLARYCERLVSHDAALRALATIRSRFYERIEPLAPAQLREYRSGELLARMVGDVDALQSLYVRGLGPPIVALLVGAASVAVAAAVLPAAGAILAVGLLLAGLVVPLAGSALSRAASRRQAGVRGQLTAELVEVLRGAPELVAYGREEETLRRVRAADRELARLARRDALAAGLAEALSILVVGATVAGVLAVAVAAHETAALDRVLVATLALLALASFDAVAPLPVAARELFGSLAAGRPRARPDRSGGCDSRSGRPRGRSLPVRRRLPRGCDRTVRSRRGAGAERHSICASIPDGGSRSSARAEPARPRSSTSFSASSILWTAA